MTRRFLKGDALLVVDAQNDFFPGGALPVPFGDHIVPAINEWLQAAAHEHIPVFASRDWHPLNHCSFKEQGGPWPVHCLQHSEGAKFHYALKFPKDTIVIDTADNPDHEAYSAFQGKTKEGQQLEKVMREQGIQRVFINGLAQDYCVCETALDARKYGFEVHLLLQGTRPITEATGQAALQRMKEAGVIIHL